MTGRHAEAFERCMGAGGVAVFAADTVYGLACDVHNRVAVERLYNFKRRRSDKPAAVMFFELEPALAALAELGPRTQSALERLLPGALTLLLPNPRARFALACGEDPGTLGLRVPLVPALTGVNRPVLQSSANRAGAPDARRLQEVPELIRRAADLVIDGGELPGIPSTVLDLRAYEDTGEWTVVRAGGVEPAAVAAALQGQFHFDPATYLEMIHADIPAYDRLQDELARASGNGARRVLELGTGTGETAARLLARHPGAQLVGIDESAEMIAVAGRRLASERVRFWVRAIEEPLPEGPFDLVASALCIHHLREPGKRDLFARIHSALAPGGRFVLADVVVPADAADAITSLTPGFDHPSSLEDQLLWLADVGFGARVTWRHADLAVVVAEVPKTRLPSDSP